MLWRDTVRESQIILPGFEHFYEMELLDPTTGYDVMTLGIAMRNEHSRILGRDNLRFIHENWERSTRIKLEKKLAEEE